MKSIHFEQAKSLIESTRYSMGTHEFLMNFIDWWAYLHTGLYPARTQLMESKNKLFQTAEELSHTLSRIMLEGVHDPLSLLLTEFSPSTSQHYAYFPTPDGIAELMSKLVAEPHSLSGTGPISIYEPCVGTAGMIFHKLKQITESRSEQDNPLAGVTIRVEDINPYAIKAFFLQIIFLLQYLSEAYGKEIMPDAIDMVCCDVLTRKQNGVQYYLSNPALEHPQAGFWAEAV